MQRIGWFDAFRENGDPTWFGENRTPVVFDLQIFALASIFITPFLAFIIILPGVRHYRIASTIAFIFSIMVGAIILISIHHPSWHQGSIQICSPYRAFTTDKLDAILGVRMGLKHLNVTLTSVPTTEKAHHLLDGLEYNERFEFLNGLPYPILKIIEYLSVDRAGFIWGRQYRLAGHYTIYLLCIVLEFIPGSHNNQIRKGRNRSEKESRFFPHLATFVGIHKREQDSICFWIVQIIMLCLVPHNFAKLVFAVGLIILSADFVYFTFVPKNFQIRFSSPNGSTSILDFHFSTCFYATLLAGVTSLIYGGILLILQAKSLYTLKTFITCHVDEHCFEVMKCKSDGMLSLSSSNSTIGIPVESATDSAIKPNTSIGWMSSLPERF
ncbi:DUOXA-like protein C06E1.3 [Dirofilaria immitis]|nr:DUOXA-like protein C06E1.3 [Dirofilaria immitis]